MTKPIPVALVGCGRIARGRHLPILLANPSFEIRALVDPDAAALESAAKRAPRASQVKIIAELSPNEVEAVIIASPPHCHAEQATHAFASGLHVYVEKPLATSREEAETLAAAWRASECVGMIGFNYRFHPMAVAAREALQRGDIGPLVAVRSIFSTPGREQPQWKQQRCTGGGVLLDLATHHGDLITHITGRRVEHVRAWLHTRHCEHDTAGLELTLEGNVLAQITVIMGAVDEDRVDIIGEDGQLVLDRVAYGNLFSRPATRAGLQKRLLQTAITASLAQMRRPKTEISTTRAIAHFGDAIRGERTASPDISDGLESMRIVLAAETDALHRQPARLHEPAARTTAPVTL